MEKTTRPQSLFEALADVSMGKERLKELLERKKQPKHKIDSVTLFLPNGKERTYEVGHEEVKSIMASNEDNNIAIFKENGDIIVFADIPSMTSNKQVKDDDVPADSDKTDQ